MERVDIADMMFSPGALPDRGVVRIGGAEAAAFLDRLVTSDLDGLAPGEGRLAALLSPQGKVLFEMLVTPATDGALLLDVPRATVADLVRRLTLYKLRTAVDITDLSADHVVSVSPAPPPPPTVAAYRDPRAAALGWRAIVATGGDTSAAAVGYDAARIAARVPELGRDYASGGVVAHEALLDRIAGVSFTKGCYVGQEIVARMEHRGTARKRFVRVTAATPAGTTSAGAALPSHGTPSPGTFSPGMGAEVRAGEALVGTLGSSVVAADGGVTGLALLRLDRLAEFAAKGVPLTADGVALTPRADDVADLMPKAPDPVAE